MNIEEAIEALQALIEPQSYTLGGYDKEAINTVLRSYNAILTNYNALEEDMDKQYSKGYQDGFNQGYLAGAMESI